MSFYEVTTNEGLKFRLQLPDYVDAHKFVAQHFNMSTVKIVERVATDSYLEYLRDEIPFRLREFVLDDMDEAYKQMATGDFDELVKFCIDAFYNKDAESMFNFDATDQRLSELVCEFFSEE